MHTKKMEEDEITLYPGYVRSSISFIMETIEAKEVATFMYQERCISKNRLDKVWCADTKQEQCQVLHPCLSTIDQCRVFMDALVRTQQEFIRDEILRRGNGF